jgi:TolA-binding protein
MEELADQLARVESENMKLKRRNRQLEERVEELESAMGASGRGGASSYAPPAPAAERSAAGTPTNRNAHAQGRHSPAPAPAGPAVSAEERAKLEGYIRELVNTGDATIITDLASVLEVRGGGGGRVHADIEAWIL